MVPFLEQGHNMSTPQRGYLQGQKTTETDTIKQYSIPALFSLIKSQKKSFKFIDFKYETTQCNAIQKCSVLS